MKRVNLVRRAISYYREADTVYKVHSPFLYEFVKEVIEKDSEVAELDRLKTWRNKLNSFANADIPWQELGADSRIGRDKKSKAIINRNISIPHRRGVWLYHLAKFLKAKRILELGTCLGISSLYLSAVNDAQITTIEGQKHLASEADNNFIDWGRKNINQIVGDIPEELRRLVQNSTKFDLIYVDAMHDSQSLNGILDELNHLTNNHSCIVFDDINWSDDMNCFWKNYQQENSGAFVDLFHWGIHFKNPSFKQNTHIRVIPKRYKPFQFVL